MAENWLKEGVLCSFGELVRIEKGPQVVELECNDANLSNKVSHANYQIGKRDALGKIIRPDDVDAASKPALDRVVARDARLGIYGVVNHGETMAVVDRKAIHAPYLWKIYQWQDSGELDDVTGEKIYKFIKVDEVAGKDEALAQAQALFEEMQ